MYTAESERKKSPRVLACASCKQRRVKCSRSFPCTNCVRAGVPCVQLTANQRRRRFAERELLDRLHHYESILRQNNISFDPLHGSSSSSSATTTATANNDDGHSATVNKDKEVTAVWQSIKRVALEDDDDPNKSDGNSSGYDDVDEQVKESIMANDDLLFGAASPDVHLAASHPEQVQIFRLWQIYLDNVNPLLKVTHTPTLQQRIIDAAGDLEHISPALEALMFSIYCTAVVSMTDDECYISFQQSRDYLLSGYQVACKLALLKCGPWRSNDRDCLTAFYLYLIAVEAQVDPRSLACMVAVAIRIAQRMGLHCESSYNNPSCRALEAEMRRRLWWSLVLFDHRICEMLGQEKSSTLSPSWGCHVPLNVNDFEMQAEMSKAPVSHDTAPTEALFAVVRSELADYVRHGVSHLTITGGQSAPGTNAHPKREADELRALETMIDKKYLAHCNVEVPLHFMTICATSGFVARCRLMGHYLTHATSTSDRPTDAQRSSAYGYAVRMLECDTKLRTSPLTKGFLWLVESMYSPILAYLHILNGLAKRPDEEYADKAWAAICDNYEAIVNGPKHHRTRLMIAFKFSRVTLQTWEARQSLLRSRNTAPERPPRLVLDARMNVMQTSSRGRFAAQPKSAENQPIRATPGPGLSTTGSIAMTPMVSTPLGLDGYQISAEVQNFSVPTSTGFYPEMSDQASTDMDMDQFWHQGSFNWVEKHARPQ
ncbi:hypothetical protein AJ78_04255 [Emergomyces pasteurianus Ep9510]|uniref:C6 finger domain transcription factor nscR n=1 Tax=Emergomyces pasteurianus Ep9510 TaxID=1447872 RepID=A0A1J9Q5J2_9EURO|nr:hypothetical protein AJ78_04255 [Emergomyces pasteurianus Ep9510]